MSPDPTANDAGTRLVRLLSLVDEEPELEDLEVFLKDSDPGVRVAALDLLTDLLPADAGAALAGALLDDNLRVREAAITALEETRPLLNVTPQMNEALDRALASPQNTVRSAVVRLCQNMGWRPEAWYCAQLSDPDASVRKEAVRGLVALDALDALRTVTDDTSVEVRRVLAASLARLRAPGTTALVAQLLYDSDLHVRAKALESLGALGRPNELQNTILECLTDPAWEVRKGAALALGAPEVIKPSERLEEELRGELAVGALCNAISDLNLEVRKAVVQSLTLWPGWPGVRHALEAALDDVDADVRGYARMALEPRNQDEHEMK